MITCTSVPVALPRDGPLTKTAIRDIVGTFISDEWPSVDPETLIVKKNDGANQNYTIERPKTQGGGADQGPRKVFLKLHNELDAVNGVFRHLAPSKHEEAQICHDYGESDRGAKVYGFFQTADGTLGRVDEFLDARNLEPGDVEDADIRATVARAYAAFHAMKQQMEEKPVQGYYDVITTQLERYHKMANLKRRAHEAGVDMDDLIDYDFAPRIRRVTERLEAMGGKKGWCMHDVSFVNVMVRNDPDPGQSKIVLVDFEFVFRNHRAFDVGGHFMQKVFRWLDDGARTAASYRPYTEDEKRHFCEMYAEQWNQETGDLDTGEQVLRESELGYLLAIAFDIHNLLCYVDQDADGELLKRLDLEAFNRLFEEFDNLYKRLRVDVHE